MNFSWEIPINQIDQFKDDLDFGFVLSHLVLQNEKYRKFYTEIAKEKDIILDNSAFELGEALPVAEIIEAGKLIEIENSKDFTIVLPDKRGDTDRTLQRSNQAVDKILKVFPNAKVMFVPQGPNISQVINCTLTFLTKFPNDKRYIKPNESKVRLGLPGRFPFSGDAKNSEQVRMGVASEILGTLVVKASDIHMLGLSNAALIPQYGRLGIGSLDTSLPFTQAIRNKLVEQNVSEKPSEPLNFEYVYSEEQINIAHKNTVFLKGLANVAQSAKTRVARRN